MIYYTRGYDLLPVLFWILRREGKSLKRWMLDFQGFLSSEFDWHKAKAAAKSDAVSSTLRLSKDKSRCPFDTTLNRTHCEKVPRYVY